MTGRPLPQELTVALGQIIRDRAGRDVTNRQIAEHVGVHPSQIGRYLSGEKSPTLEEIRLMSEAVGADWLDVLNEAHDLAAGLHPSDAALIDSADKLTRRQRERAKRALKSDNDVTPMADKPTRGEPLGSPERRPRSADAG